MADQDGRGGIEGIDDPDDVGHQAGHVVSRNLLGFVAAAVAAHVRRDDTVSRVRDGLNLMSPGIPELRPTMDHDDQRAAAFDGRAQLQAVGLDHVQRKWVVRHDHAFTMTSGLGSFDYPYPYPCRCVFTSGKRLGANTC